MKRIRIIRSLYANNFSENAKKKTKKSYEHLFDRPMLQRVLIFVGWWWLLSHKNQQKGKYVHMNIDDQLPPQNFLGSFLARSLL